MFKNKKENENISNDNNNIQKIINEKTPLNSSLNQEEYNKYEKLKATIDNVVFVNFHKNDFYLKKFMIFLLNQMIIKIQIKS